MEGVLVALRENSRRILAALQADVPEDALGDLLDHREGLLRELGERLASRSRDRQHGNAPAAREAVSADLLEELQSLEDATLQALSDQREAVWRELSALLKARWVASVYGSGTGGAERGGSRAEGDGRAVATPIYLDQEG